ncbi:hypothetical protein ISCGN_021214 [Ixodes scapularis]
MGACTWRKTNYGRNSVENLPTPRNTYIITVRTRVIAKIVSRTVRHIGSDESAPNRSALKRTLKMFEAYWYSHSRLYTGKAWQIATRRCRRKWKGRAVDNRREESHVTGAPPRRDAETHLSRAMECPLVLLAFFALPLLSSSGLKTMFRVLAAAKAVR